MKIIGYKCQHCKKNFPTDDLDHEIKCEKSVKDQKIIAKKFSKIKSDISVVVFNQLSVSKILINLIDTSVSLVKEIEETPHQVYDIKRRNQKINDKILYILNAVIKIQMRTYMPNDNQYCFSKKHHVDLIRSSVLRKFKKVYPKLNMW